MSKGIWQKWFHDGSHFRQKRLCRALTNFAGERCYRPQLVFWRRPIFPAGCPASIVGADGFHDRVRNGNGWDTAAMTTRKQRGRTRRGRCGSRDAPLPKGKRRLFGTPQTTPRATASVNRIGKKPLRGNASVLGGNAFFVLS